MSQYLSQICFCLLLTLISWVASAQANFNYIPTNQSAFFRGIAQINGMPAEAADSIAAFDLNGNCVGANPIIVNEGEAFINLAIYGDDSTTDLDEGMNIGEAFVLKIYDASENRVIDYTEEEELVSFDGWQNTNGTPLPNYNDLTRVFNFIYQDPVMNIETVQNKNLNCICTNGDIKVFNPPQENGAWKLYNMSGQLIQEVSDYKYIDNQSFSVSIRNNAPNVYILIFEGKTYRKKCTIN